MGSVLPVPAEAISEVMLSQRDVIGVQFATQQNNSVQVNPDDLFRDPGLQDSDWSDQALWHKVGDAQPSYIMKDAAVLVNRGSLDLPTGEISGIDQPPLHVVTGGDPLELDHFMGGLEGPLVPLSPQGRVHAAVRFIPLTDITTPLALQIVSQSGNVLASKAVIGRKNQVVEDYITYVINSYLPHYDVLTSLFHPQRHLPHEPMGPLTAPSLTYIGSVPDVEDVDDDLVRVRLVQFGETSDMWKMDALSLFDESIFWEFSNDGGDAWHPAYGVRNFVNGVLSFPSPGRALCYRVTGYREGLSISALQIRPWYRHQDMLRTVGHYRGPNVSTWDQELPIQDDPEFTTWGKPIPKTWFLAGRPYPVLFSDPEMATNEFSSHYARVALDSIPLPAGETAVRSLVMFRYGFVIWDPEELPHEIPGEFLTTTDEASRIGEFGRTTTDVLPMIADEANAMVIPYEEDPINRPPDSPL